MVSRLFSTSFDEDIDKATSELIPKDHDDITLYLEISDQIRSKSVSAKDAMRALKRRIAHTNPNVQLLALSLLDTCVKNGGHHFLIEVASREFVDSLMLIVRSPSTNPEVRIKLLGLIQTWALAFEGKPELVLVTETYRLLKSEGCGFPKIDRTTSVMIDTATAPAWTDSDECVRCRTPFTMFNRKHHCRNCGQTFCGECSSKTSTLPHYGINDQVRVCDPCHAKRQVKAKSVDLTNSKKDEEIKKAIELSLKEAESKNHFQPAQKKEEEDDLAAAIEASLREMNINQSRSFSYTQQPSYNANSYNSSAYTPYSSKLSNTTSSPAPYELSTIEAENIYQFSELLERIQQSGGDLMRDRQVQELHDRIGELKPKLTKNLAETIQKHQDLVEMHEKLAQVVKIYDRLLEERMSSAYARRSYPVTQRATSSITPNNGITYPTITTNAHTSNIYTQSPSYPVASAPAPSPTYYSQTAPLSQQYIPPQSNPVESVPIVNQQALTSQQQAQPQQSQSSYAPYAYTSTPISYTPNLNENTVNTAGTPSEFGSNVTTNQQGYKPQTNGIINSSSASYTPQTNGIVGSASSYNPQTNSTNSVPQSNGSNSVYATSQATQLAPPSQQNYYQYQTPPSSQQILPPTQIEEAPLIEL
ncbi:4138_t:CDS:10 [Rhizophagus irregularis]|nr:4138_t:CDS:10 [Rhizophagus irregularis]